MAHGANVLPRVRGKGFAGRFFENLGDPIIKILLAALALEVVFTFGNCNLVEVFGIVTAILIATLVSTLSELGSERAFAKMEEESSEGRVRVIRGGKTLDIPAEELVVGDVILLSAGERVFADAEMIEGELSVDQSALNGENIEARKCILEGGAWSLDNVGRVFRGSIVTSGSGMATVGRVGSETYYGAVARDVQSETRISPLKLRLGALASQISKLGYLAAGLVGFAYLFNSIFAKNGFDMGQILETLKNPSEIFSILIHALTLMITVVVVAVPEGLPMMVTVVLSANMKRMLKDNILVKKLVGIETAGSMNILFTDKTGTLTTGVLACDEFITDKGSCRGMSALKKQGYIYDLLLLSSIYNNEAELGQNGIIGGNSTDRALLDFFSKESHPVEDVIGREAFSSDKKYSSVTFSNRVTLLKGAPERILSGVRLAVSSGGEIYASDLSSVRSRYAEAVAHGSRVIAVTVRRPDSEGDIFVSLIVLRDKLRDGVKKTVTEVLSAGIQIVMLTGDNGATAESIAEECGFYRRSAGHIAISSEELARMSDDEVMNMLPSLRVLYRALPQDKKRLVELSQRLDLVVGMTGDGINDAPSLRLADVGFAMGSGTDIAKGAGDVVIIDNSFLAISKTILYGRTIFKSIRKFISFQLIMNLAACGITLLGQIIGIDNPITIIQMLWVNIIMDTLGGLAFAGEPPLSYYMKEKPKRRDEPIISGDMLRHIVLNGVFTLALLIFFLRSDAIGHIFPGYDRRLTAFYALFIFAGLFNCLGARCERMWIFTGIGRNKPFIFIMLFISVIQVMIIYFGGELFRSTPLTLREFATAVAMSATVLAFDIVSRLFHKLK